MCPSLLRRAVERSADMPWWPFVSSPMPQAGPASGSRDGPVGSQCARGCRALLARNKVCCWQTGNRPCGCDQGALSDALERVGRRRRGPSVAGLSSYRCWTLTFAAGLTEVIPLVPMRKRVGGFGVASRGCTWIWGALILRFCCVCAWASSACVLATAATRKM